MPYHLHRGISFHTCPDEISNGGCPNIGRICDEFIDRDAHWPRLPHLPDDAQRHGAVLACGLRSEPEFQTLRAAMLGEAANAGINRVMLHVERLDQIPAVYFVGFGIELTGHQILTPWLGV